MDRKRVIYLERAVPLLASFSLLLSAAIVSASKPLWNDELLSFYLLHDPSIVHMLAAWSDKFNQAPPLYFILGWFWDKIFGPTDLSLRLLSSVSLGVAVTLIWLTLRRTYSFWVATLAVLMVFSFSSLVAIHNVEIRMYGLFAATCALGLFCYDQIQCKDDIPKSLLVVNGLAHAAILLTHLYGVFYSSAFLGSFVVADFFRQRFRLKVYLSVLSGWIVLLPLVVLIVKQSNNHAKWFTVKSLPELIGYYIYTPKLPYLLVGFLIVSIFLRISSSMRWRSRSKGLPDVSSPGGELPLLVLALAFMVVPFLAWLITVSIRPMLVDRYIIPTVTTGWPILWAYLLARLLPADLIGLDRPKSSLSMLNPRNCILGTIVLFCLLYPVSQSLKASGQALRPGEKDGLYGHRSLPIAMEAGHDFLPRFHYAANQNRYFHVRDWDTAVKNTSSPFATGDFTHLEALSRRYPFIQSVESNEFLSRFESFLVFDEPDQKWFEARVKNSPHYRIKKLGVEKGANAQLTVYLVEPR